MPACACGSCTATRTASSPAIRAGCWDSSSPVIQPGRPNGPHRSTAMYRFDASLSSTVRVDTDQPAAPQPTAGPLTPLELERMQRYWDAANYLTVGQIYLLANPLLREPLRPEHIKPRLLGHWGTSPGLNLVYTHLNRVIRSRDLDAICVWGPGHGGPAVLAGSWLEGSYTETYPDITRDEAGMARLFKQFSFPGGVPS